MTTTTRLLSEWTNRVEVSPRVSVVCWTYNHEKLITQTLDSILMQNVSFPVEVIVHDDASTDANQKIIQEYADRYPNTIRAILRTENQLQNGMNFVPSLFNSCRGKYIAICDGDDYWTDPEKIARQVKCLEDNPQAAGCFHAADDLFEDTGEIRSGFWKPKPPKSEYTLDDMLRSGNQTATASLMLRSRLVQNIPGTIADAPHGDFVFLVQATMSGPLIFMEESMSVYRRHAGGIHSTTYGSIAIFRALKSLLYVGKVFQLQNRDSFHDGVSWRMKELENSTQAERTRMASLENELQNLRENYDRARQSKFFRVGTAIQHLMKRLELQKTTKKQKQCR